MSKKICRIGSKTEASHLVPPILSARTNIVSKAPNNGTIFDRLGGIEDIAQCDSSGVPFIMVDGVCVRTRPQLLMALAKREKKTMERIRRQCCVLPWLQHTRSATKAEPTTESEKETKDEVDFQEDLELLNLDMLRVQEINPASQRSGSVTPIAHSPSDEDLVLSMSRMDEIRIQLEQLREQQQTDFTTPIPMSEQLRIRRQATFDIERDEPTKMTSSSIDLISQFPGATKERLARATTLSQLPIQSSRPTIQKVNSAGGLCKKSSTSIVQESNNAYRLEPFSTERSHEVPILDQIGNLLLKLPHQKEKPLLNTGSYPYLVTISPNLGCTSCSVEPISTTHSLTFPNTTRCVSERMKIDSPIDIAVQPALQPKSRTFLKIPRLFKKMKK